MDGEVIVIRDSDDESCHTLIENETDSRESPTPNYGDLACRLFVAHWTNGKPKSDEELNLAKQKYVGGLREKKADSPTIIFEKAETENMDIKKIRRESPKESKRDENHNHRTGSHKHHGSQNSSRSNHSSNSQRSWHRDTAAPQALPSNRVESASHKHFKRPSTSSDHSPSNKKIRLSEGETKQSSKSTLIEVNLFGETPSMKKYKIPKKKDSMNAPESNAPSASKKFRPSETSVISVKSPHKDKTEKRERERSNGSSTSGGPKHHGTTILSPKPTDIVKKHRDQKSETTADERNGIRTPKLNGSLMNSSEKPTDIVKKHRDQKSETTADERNGIRTPKLNGSLMNSSEKPTDIVKKHRDQKSETTADERNGIRTPKLNGSLMNSSEKPRKEKTNRHKRSDYKTSSPSKNSESSSSKANSKKHHHKEKPHSSSTKKHETPRHPSPLPELDDNRIDKIDPKVVLLPIKFNMLSRSSSSTEEVEKEVIVGEYVVVPHRNSQFTILRKNANDNQSKAAEDPTAAECSNESPITVSNETAVSEIAVTKEVAVASEIAITSEVAVSDEIPVADRVPIAGEVDVGNENTVADEVAEVITIDEDAVTDEDAAVADKDAVAEVITIDEDVVAEEDAVVNENAIADVDAVADEEAVGDEETVVDEVAVTDEVAVADKAAVSNEDAITYEDLTDDENINDCDADLTGEWQFTSNYEAQIKEEILLYQQREMEFKNIMKTQEHEIERLNSSLEEKNLIIEEREKNILERESMVAERNQRVSDRDLKINDLEAEKAQQLIRINRLELEVARCKQQVLVLSSFLKEKQHECDENHRPKAKPRKRRCTTNTPAPNNGLQVNSPRTSPQHDQMPPRYHAPANISSNTPSSVSSANLHEQNNSALQALLRTSAPISNSNFNVNDHINGVSYKVSLPTSSSVSCSNVNGTTNSVSVYGVQSVQPTSSIYVTSVVQNSGAGLSSIADTSPVHQQLVIPNWTANVVQQPPLQSLQNQFGLPSTSQMYQQQTTTQFDPPQTVTATSNGHVKPTPHQMLPQQPERRKSMSIRTKTTPTNMQKSYDVNSRTAIPAQRSHRVLTHKPVATDYDAISATMNSTPAQRSRRLMTHAPGTHNGMTLEERLQKFYEAQRNKQILERQMQQQQQQQHQQQIRQQQQQQQQMPPQQMQTQQMPTQQMQTQQMQQQQIQTQQMQTQQMQPQQMQPQQMQRQQMQQQQMQQQQIQQQIQQQQIQQQQIQQQQIQQQQIQQQRTQQLQQQQCQLQQQQQQYNLYSLLSTSQPSVNKKSSFYCMGCQKPATMLCATCKNNSSCSDFCTQIIAVKHRTECAMPNMMDIDSLMKSLSNTRGEK